MRKIFLLVFTLISLSVFGQFPNDFGISNSKTQYYVKGGMGADSSFIFRTAYADTTAANRGFQDAIPGCIIRTTGGFIWMRNDAATAWIYIGGSAGGGTNIYNSDGTLTGNRNVYINSNDLSFYSGGVSSSKVLYFSPTSNYIGSPNSTRQLLFYPDSVLFTGTDQSASSSDSVLVRTSTGRVKTRAQSQIGGSTPGIDDVLAVGQQITQNRNVNNGGYNLSFYSNTNKLTARVDSLQRVQAEWLTALNDTASDFEIILVPDMQNEAQTYFAQGRSIFEWIRDNKTSKNIKAVIGLGDMTNNGISPELDTADAWFDLLDPLDIPYTPTIGNHDYNSNNPTSRNCSNFLSWFGPGRLNGKSWYGGDYSPAPESFFTKFDLMGRKFGTISLEFFPRDAVIAWADSVLSANSDRTFFYVTHAYLNSFGERATDTSVHSGIAYMTIAGNARGDSQWLKLIKVHKNIAFTFNGHYLNLVNGDKGFTRRFTDVGDSGNVVNQFYVNYQMDTSGGNGWFTRLQFHPKENRIDVKYYSAYLGRYDQRVESFSYQFPAISVQSSLAIKGTLSVKNEARFDSSVSFEKLTKFRIPFIGEGGRLVDTSLFRMDNDSVRVISDYFEATKTLAASDSSKLLTSTDWQKRNFIQNQITGPKTSNFYINGQGVITSHTTPGYRSALQSGLPATMYVTQGSGNYGLSIQRATVSNGYPQLTFFKTRSTDFTTLGSASVGDPSGGINYMSVAPDGSTITTMARILDYNEGGSGSLNYVGLQFFTSGASTGQLGGSMYLNGNGVLQVGGMNTSTSNAYLEINGTTRGFLPPRLTTAQMNAISSPGTGLVVWNKDSAAFCSYNGIAWRIDGISALGFGSGSTNYLPKWSSATALSNSVIYDDGTNIGIGTASPSAKLHVISTTEQLRVGYDASNYYKTTVGSTGGVTFDAVGSGANFTFSDAVTLGNLPSGAVSDSVLTDASGAVRHRKVSDLISPYVTTGTYTPTLSNTTNVSASTAYQCQYSVAADASGNQVVTVSGEVDIDPTTTVTLTVLRVTLPITSNVGQTYEIGGTANDELGTPARISGNVANDVAEIRFTPVDVTNRTFSFVFVYKVNIP